MSAALDAEDARPALIAIEHDDYHAEYVGHLADGRQFFLLPRSFRAMDLIRARNSSLCTYSTMTAG